MNKSAWPPFVLCLISALALHLARGNVPGERAYAAFQSARDLSGWTASPLFVALLAGAGRLGLLVPQMGLLLSMAGLLATLLAVYWIGLRLKRPVAAIFAAAALTLEPTLYSLVGQDALFVMGWLWSALASIKLTSIFKSTPQIRNPAVWGPSLALIVLTVSILCHVNRADLLTLAASYGPALIPGLALLIGLLLDKLVALANQLPFAWRHDEQFAFRAILVALALTAVGYARGTSQMWSRASRDAAEQRWALWKQAGTWLKQNTLPDATVWSDVPGANSVLGYFAERRIVSLAAPETPPDYAVAVNSLTWMQRQNQPWFQEHYRRVYAIVNPYDSLAPLSVYRYRPGPFDLGSEVSIGARFGEVIELISYRLDSTQLIPGEAQHLTLTWRTLEQLTRTLHVRVRLRETSGHRVWIQVDNVTPANLNTRLWPVNRPLPDHYTLKIPDDLPSGTYQMQVQVLYAENEASPAPNLDHPLGDVVTLMQLEVQPWISDTPLSAARPLLAAFGNHPISSIELIGYSLQPASGTTPIIERGGTLRVRLYWHALTAPGADYHVFVHLLTDDNRLVAQQDSAPVFETWPTDRWQAGQYILDEHIILIDTATPPGRYWLKVGMYTPADGERIVVRDAAGRELPERSLPLVQVEIE